jgi:protein-S-isoprenylcysteine O-methyltransferase Ste14
MRFAVVGAALCTLGTLIELWATFELGWRRALDLTDQPPDPALPWLVFRGPFRWVRHPQSLGLLVILAGTAVAVRSPVLWLVTIAVGALVVAMARRHDRELMLQCGAAYGRYRGAVPFLVPWPRR